MTCSVLFEDLDKIKQQLHTFGHSEKNSSLSNCESVVVLWCIYYVKFETLRDNISRPFPLLSVMLYTLESTLSEIQILTFLLLISPSTCND